MIKQKLFKVFASIFIIANLISVFGLTTYSQYASSLSDNTAYPEGPISGNITNIDKLPGETLEILNPTAGIDSIKIEFKSATTDGSIFYTLTPTSEFGNYPNGQGILSLKIITENIVRSEQIVTFRFSISKAFSNVQGYVINSPVRQVGTTLVSSGETFNTYETTFNGVPLYFGVSGEQETFRTGSQSSFTALAVIMLISLGYVLFETFEANKSIIKR